MMMMMIMIIIIIPSKNSPLRWPQQEAALFLIQYIWTSPYASIGCVSQNSYCLSLYLIFLKIQTADTLYHMPAALNSLFTYGLTASYVQPNPLRMWWRHFHDGHNLWWWETASGLIAASRYCYLAPCQWSVCGWLSVIGLLMRISLYVWKASAARYKPCSFSHQTM